MQNPEQPAWRLGADRRSLVLLAEAGQELPEVDPWAVQVEMGSTELGMGAGMLPYQVPFVDVCWEVGWVQEDSGPAEPVAVGAGAVELALD